MLHISRHLLHVLNKATNREFFRIFPPVLCLTSMLHVLHGKLHISCEMLHVPCFTSVVACLTLLLHVSRHLLHVLNKVKIRKYSRIFSSVSCLTSILHVLRGKFHISRVMLHIWRRYFMFYIRCCICWIKPNDREYSRLFHVWRLYCMFDVRCCMFHVKAYLENELFIFQAAIHLDQAAMHLVLVDSLSSKRLTA